MLIVLLEDNERNAKNDDCFMHGTDLTVNVFFCRISSSVVVVVFSGDRSVSSSFAQDATCN